MDWASILKGAFFGIILLSIVYDAVLYVALRRDFLIWHGVRAVAIAIAMIASLPLVLPGFFDDPAVREVVRRLAIDTSIAVTGPFLCALIERGKLSSSMRRALRLCLPAVFATTFIKLGFTDVPRALDLLRDFVLLGVLALLFAGLTQAISRGSRTALYQSAAWLMVLVIGILDLYYSIVFASGLPNWEAWIAIALTIEVVVTAACIADRVMMVARQRDRAFVRERSLREAAYTDPLTGLPNRRALRVKFLSRKGLRPTGIAIVDLDHFKRVNDRFGHDVGDQVLQAVGKALSANGRFAARLGGEEFALLLYGSDWARQAENARRTITSVVSAEVPELEYPITASAGLARVEGDERFATILRSADRALYAAKNAGRNRSLALTEFSLSQKAQDAAAAA